jgi:2-keto-4-pentenoate hydratase/2-oxohepta-3-ene-1,7-dioic acid hydratase in catechol pathway
MARYGSRPATDDMYWSVKQIIHHLTQGTKLQAGTVIMTGTPSGVGRFQKKYLKEGDVVEVEIEAFEKLRNVVKFE